MTAARPIGIFDSGIGGLSVAREIRRLMPHEPLLYLADTAYCPYGDREADEVRERSRAAGAFLQSEGAKVIVVACNTASGAALEILREALQVPVVGLEPAVKTAVGLTRNRRVGVMATTSTLRSERYLRLVRVYAEGFDVIPQPCPGLVDLIEGGQLEGDALDARIAVLGRPLQDAAVDTVVLGCTHYPFVRGAIERFFGPAVQLVDSGPAVARRTEHLVRESATGAGPGDPGVLRLVTTGDARVVGPVAERLWGDALDVVAASLSSGATAGRA
jgi:glutamate racemase